jgi:hypothetical protein
MNPGAMAAAICPLAQASAHALDPVGVPLVEAGSKRKNPMQHWHLLEWVVKLWISQSDQYGALVIP